MDAIILSALAEPNRLRIVELLRDNPYPVGEIATRLGLRQPQVSKHLHVLSQAGLVEVRPAAQQRIYHLRPAAFEQLDGWLETFRRSWEARLDALDGVLQDLKQEQKHTGSQPD